MVYGGRSVVATQLSVEELSRVQIPSVSHTLIKKPMILSLAFYDIIKTNQIIMNILEKIILIIFTILMVPFSFFLYSALSSYQTNNTEPIIINIEPVQKEIAKEEPIDKTPVVEAVINSQLSNPPKIIKAVYVTSSSAGSQEYIKYLDNLFKTTEINAVVIDIKNYSGKTTISDNLANLVKELHNKGIYVIARIVVFEDEALIKARPDLAIYDKLKTTDPKNPVLWVDNHNLSWVDPASKEAWDYNISIAKDAVNHGFDELNFDYIRFPSDGKVEDMGFPFWDKKTSMHLIIKEFFQKLRESLPGVKLSADLFGYSAVATDDMGIGQVLEDSFDYFDYISLMVYPSHYRNGFRGYSNPAEHPYEVIKYSMQEALRKQTEYYNKLQIAGEKDIMNKSKFRPWLQDFNMGATYNAEMVKAEIKATTDVLGDNFNGFMLWNPYNVYTVGAINKAETK